jgi:RNA polymerase sigma factor (sigma-70 family)
VEAREWHDPLDVLQDVFLTAFCLADDCPISDEASAVRWLKTIARRHIIDLERQRRSLKRGGGALARPRRGSVVALLEELAVYRRTPSRSAAAHEFRRVVDEALGRLPADHAEAVRLRHVEGLSLREAAAQMGRTERAVEHLCARGLEGLRLALGTQSVI